jgi:hypothetical protein
MLYTSITIMNNLSPKGGNLLSEIPNSLYSTYSRLKPLQKPEGQARLATNPEVITLCISRRSLLRQNSLHRDTSD